MVRQVPADENPEIPFRPCFPLLKRRSDALDVVLRSGRQHVHEATHANTCSSRVASVP